MGVLQNSKHELFAQARAQGMSADQAYVLAGFRPNRSNASRLNANERVRARVTELQLAGAARAEVSVENVLRELWGIATADPNELVEHRVGCCRCCWGKRFRHQETPGERSARRATWLKDKLAAAGTDLEADFAEFDELGGVGFNATLPPNPDCPECFGQGMGQVVIKDTRRASAGARALYGGAKVTKDGLEVKLNDKVAALTKVGQHLGMFIDRKITAEVGLEDLLDQLDAEDASEPEAAAD